jgi:hypothetical protein
MVSEATSVTPSLATIVPAVAPSPVAKVQAGGGSGSSLPAGGNPQQAAAAPSAPATSSAGAAQPSVDAADPQSIVAFLNKYLNDSGLPDRFRLDPTSGGKFIQEINPSSGAVVAEYAIAEFPALARGIGASGLLIDGLA